MSGMARGCIAMRCAAMPCVAVLRTGARARAHMHAFTRAHSHASARVPVRVRVRVREACAYAARLRVVRGRVACAWRDASFFIFLRGPNACA